VLHVDNEWHCYFLASFGGNFFQINYNQNDWDKHGSWEMTPVHYGVSYLYNFVGSFDGHGKKMMKAFREEQ
jgi:hypothetical protein